MGFNNSEEQAVNMCMCITVVPSQLGSQLLPLHFTTEQEQKLQSFFKCSDSVTLRLNIGIFCDFLSFFHNC